MRLFKQKTSDSPSVSNRPPSSELLFLRCEQRFLASAKSFGYVKDGSPRLATVLDYGKACIKVYYRERKKEDCTDQRGNPDPEGYYRIAVYHAIETGLFAAYSWQRGTLSRLSPEKAWLLPPSLISELISKFIHLDPQTMLDFKKIIADHWFEMIEPYWKTNDAQSCIETATLAAFQVGVSMFLAKT